MQGEWVDKGGGALYMVSGRTIKRDDGRKFGLHIMRGVIGWGPSGNYYAVPDVSLQEEVRWLSAGSGRAAFVWERPRSPCSERSGGGPAAQAVELQPALEAGAARTARRSYSEGSGGVGGIQPDGVAGRRRRRQ